MTVTSKLRALGYTDKEIRKFNKRLNRFDVKFTEVVEVSVTSCGSIRFYTNRPDSVMVEMYTVATDD